MQLRELQRQFARQVFATQLAEVEQTIVSRGIEPERRLQIYGNNIRTTLADALKDIYSVTCDIVGEEFFAHLARQYSLTHPPANGDICQYGENLPSFINQFEQLKDLKYLPDIAKIDWFSHVSFHSPSHETAGIERLAEIPEGFYEQLCFTVHPSVCIIESRYPVFDIWNFAQTDDSETQPPKIDSEGQCVLIIRQADATRVILIDRELFAFINLIKQGATLGQAISELLDIHPSYNLQLQLHKVFSLGAISKVTVNCESS